jgi:hypothetical protein
MWSHKTLAGAGIALVVIAGVDAIRSWDHQTTAPPKTGTTTVTDTRYRRCARRDIVVAVEVRRPSSLQTTDIPEEAGKRPVATIVVGNVSARRCLGTWGARFTITDRAGKIVGSWPDSAWFVGYYLPGREKTFSYPNIYRCGRTGPFVALATVGPYSASRRNLSRSQIAGHVHTGCRAPIT